MYRYAFNGKEKDQDIGDNDYDYGMRIHDARLGRFLSVDPLTKTYPWYTPYQFAGNRPIVAIDLDGMEPHDVNTNQINNEMPATDANYNSSNESITYGKNVRPWKDLSKFKIPTSVLNGVRSRGIEATPQNIEDAHSTETNFDYYSVKITSLPTGVKDAGELLEKIRHGIGGILDKDSKFGAYNSTERKIWESNNPLGAVMSFDALFGYDWIPDALRNLDDASVITSSYYKNNKGGYWTFSTVTTPGDGTHPISGTRQFGVSTITTGNVTSYLFYIRATDRAFNFIESKLQKTVFESAENTWNSVCNGVFNYVNSQGGNALVPSIPISKRIPSADVGYQHDVDWFH